MQGYNGSQLWDTAFWAQAVVESGLGNQFASSVKKINNYLNVSQVYISSIISLSPIILPLFFSLVVSFIDDNNRYHTTRPIWINISDTFRRVLGLSPQ